MKSRYLREVQKAHRKEQQRAPIQLGDVRKLAQDGRIVMISAGKMMLMSDAAFIEAYENSAFKIMGTEEAMLKVKERASTLGVVRQQGGSPLPDDDRPRG